MTVKAIRIELGDTSPEFPIMSDDEYRYFLDKNDWSIRRTALDAAKSMMLKLSMRTDETVDIFSIKGSGAAKQFMQALQMYISNPDLNPIYQNAMPYAGGISKSDMNANDSNLDNNIIVQPTQSPNAYPTGYFTI
jgi:hypothetical protein